jgi:predicted transcriptional regulator
MTLNSWLGPLETEVMQIIWQAPGPIQVRDVRKIMSARREIAHTTVMTTMARLAEKGILCAMAPGGASESTIRRL